MGNVIMKARQIQHGATNVEEALNLLSPQELIEMSKRMDAIEAWKKRVRDSVNTGSNMYVINNALKVPVKALSLNLLPIQGGSGDPSPTNIRPISGRTEVNLGRTGKNLLPMTLAGLKEINTGGTWSNNVYTLRGVTFTVNTDNDGYITGIVVNNTATADATLILALNIKGHIFNGQYLKGAPSGGSASTYFMLIQQNTPPWTTYSGDYGDGSVVSNIPDDATVQIFIRVKSGTAMSNKVFYPFIGSAEDTFEPYMGQTLTIALGQTVYGGTLDVKTGVLTIDKAILDCATLNLTYGTSGGGLNWIDIPSIIEVKADAISDKMETFISGNDGWNSTAPCISINNNTSKQLRIYGTNADFAENGAYSHANVCYELATPTTVQLTGAELEMLKGYNLISTDADSMDVTALVLGGEA